MMLICYVCWVARQKESEKSDAKPAVAIRNADVNVIPCILAVADKFDN